MFLEKHHSDRGKQLIRFIADAEPSLNLCHSNLFIQYAPRYTKAVFASLGLSPFFDEALLQRVVDALHLIIIPNCSDIFQLATVLTQMRNHRDNHGALLQWVSSYEQRRDALWGAYTIRDVMVLGRYIQTQQTLPIIFSMKADDSYDTIFHRAIHDDNVGCLALLSGNVTGISLLGLNQRNGLDATPLDVAARSMLMIHLRYLSHVVDIEIFAIDGNGRTSLSMLFIALEQRWKAQRVEATQRLFPSAAAATAPAAGISSSGSSSDWLQHPRLPPSVAGTTATLRPSVSEVITTITEMLQSVRIEDMMFLRDRSGYSAVDYALSLRDVRILSPIFRQMKPFLDSTLDCSRPAVAQQILPTLETMLRHAVLLNASDVVSSVAEIYTFYLRQQHYQNSMTTNESPNTTVHTSPHMASGHINDDSHRMRPMSDFLVLAIEQSCDHSLHSLLGLDVFKQAINTPSSGWSWSIDIDSSRIRNQNHGCTPLEAACYQLALPWSSYHSNHSHAYSYKKDDEREEHFHLTVLRTVLRAGADPFTKLTQHLRSLTSDGSNSSITAGSPSLERFTLSTLGLPFPDNIFALTAYLGSIPALRVLLLAYPDAKCLPVSVANNIGDGRYLQPNLSDVVDHHHRFGRHSAAQSLRTRTSSVGRIFGGEAGGGGRGGTGMGFLMGSSRFVSNPLCYAIAKGHGSCLQYLMDHTPFVALANTPLTMMPTYRYHHLPLHMLTPLAMAAAWNPSEPFLVTIHSHHPHSSYLLITTFSNKIFLLSQPYSDPPYLILALLYPILTLPHSYPIANPTLFY